MLAWPVASTSHVTTNGRDTDVVMLGLGWAF
jgi:hypothetical protein